MTQEKLEQLKATATEVRRGILTEVHAAKSGHPGGSLSVADIITYLYSEVLRVDPENPRWEDRDRLVLSKGHTCPAPQGGADHLPRDRFPSAGPPRYE